jgi:hypothetical protein
LSIHKLDHVIDEGFLTVSLTTQQNDENKLVYYLLEDAVSSSTVASKYVRRAAVWNGHEAYFLLYDGFALSGPANAAILLGQLSNFRCMTDESPSELVLRLQELFEDLEAVPGTAAMTLKRLTIFCLPFAMSDHLRLCTPIFRINKCKGAFLLSEPATPCDSVVRPSG